MYRFTTFDQIRADHRDRLETARLQSRHAARATRARPSGERRGRPPEPPAQPRPRDLRGSGTAR